MVQRKNITLTLCLAGLFIVVLSFIVPKNSEKYLKDLFWVTKTFTTEKYNVVLMGDSRMYRGLSPEIMEETLPELRILNFGYSNGGLNPTMFRAAEEKLAPDRRIIVLGVTANSLTDYTKANKQYLQELQRPREEIIECKYFNPVKYWFSATSPQKLKTHFSDKNAEEKRWYKSSYFMNGYVASDKFPIDTMEAIPSYTKDFTKFQVEEQHMQTLFAQIKNWSEKGITVLAFRPPTSLPMRQLEDEMGKYNDEKLKAGIEHAGGHWIALNPSKFKTYDGSHVDLASAEKLSRVVATKILEVLE